MKIKCLYCGKMFLINSVHECGPYRVYGELVYIDVKARKDEMKGK